MTEGEGEGGGCVIQKVGGLVRLALQLEWAVLSSAGRARAFLRPPSRRAPTANHDSLPILSLPFPPSLTLPQSHLPRPLSKMMFPSTMLASAAAVLFAASAVAAPEPSEPSGTTVAAIGSELTTQWDKDTKGGWTDTTIRVSPTLPSVDRDGQEHPL